MIKSILWFPSSFHVLRSERLFWLFDMNLAKGTWVCNRINWSRRPIFYELSQLCRVFFLFRLWVLVWFVFVDYTVTDWTPNYIVHCFSCSSTIVNSHSVSTNFYFCTICSSWKSRVCYVLENYFIMGDNGYQMRLKKNPVHSSIWV